MSGEDGVPPNRIHRVPSPITASAKSEQFLRSYRDSSRKTDKALERLSTGKRINRPSDDPAGFVTAESLRGELVRLTAELKNVRSNRSATRIEQSGLSHLEDQLIELRGMIVGAAGNVLTESQRQVFGDQIAESLEAIDRMRQQLAQASSSRASATNAALRSIDRVVDGVDGTDLEADAVLVDSGLDSVVLSRAALAAYERYELDVMEQLYQGMVVTHTQALSQVEDADIAEETSNLIASQTMAAGALAALAMSGSLHADQVESLLEGVREQATDSA
jgi:flagellin